MSNGYISQTSACGARDHKFTPQHMAKTSEACYKTHVLIMKMSFRQAVYPTSQFKRFPYLDITNKLSKENTVLQFVYFTQMKALIFSFEIDKRTSCKWLNIQLQ